MSICERVLYDENNVFYIKKRMPHLRYMSAYAYMNKYYFTKFWEIIAIFLVKLWSIHIHVQRKEGVRVPYFVCGLTIVGPKLIISVLGNTFFNRPHSRPAWTAHTLAGVSDMLL